MIRVFATITVTAMLALGCDAGVSVSVGTADGFASGGAFGSDGEFCGTGLSTCEGQCVDLQSDRNHCRSCSRACAGERVCSLGECLLPSELPADAGSIEGGGVDDAGSDDAGPDDAGADAG